MTLRVLGVGEGDEVITTPYTYSATAEVIRNVGAKIVFVDLDGSSFEMNYCKVAEAITPRTKAIRFYLQRSRKIMNRNLNNAINGIEKADALMFAIEKAYLDFEFMPEELERANRGTNAFYALWDIVHNIAESLEELAGDADVVDAIKAVQNKNAALNFEN